MPNAFSRAIGAHAPAACPGHHPTPPASKESGAEPVVEAGHSRGGSGASFSFHHGLLEETTPPSSHSPPSSNTSLVPKPTSSPDDPLNWSWAKKHAVLLSLIPGALLSDWTLTWGTTVFQLQAPEWGMTIEAVAQSVSPGIFMQGPGGILSVPLCQRYGRLPVLFWSQLLSLVFTLGAMAAPTYASFTAMRALQGFFGAAPQVIGLSMVHDMFFFHERTRKINIWAASFLVGPYLGPFISSLLLLALGWRADFAVLAGFYGLSVAMVILLGDETLFDRRDAHPPHSGCSVCGHRSERSLAFRVLLLLGVEGFRRAEIEDRPALLAVFWHQCQLLTRPGLLLLTAVFVLPITMWTIGLVSTVSQFVLPPPVAGGYGFSYVGLAMLYWAPMLGTLAAELWGRWLNDALAQRYMGRFGPESRLTAVYPAVVIGAAGLVLIGQTLRAHLSWAGIAVGWGMVCFSTLACMTVVSAYLLDIFPRHAALASAWICFWRVIGGFTVVYFQVAWVRRDGPGVAFGCQAAVMVGASLSIAATQWWGREWRTRFPAPEGEN